MSVKIEDVIQLVEFQLGAADARAEDRIIEDLGAESMDIVGILVAVDDKYSVHVDEMELQNIRTIADLAASIARHTDAG